MSGDPGQRGTAIGDRQQDRQARRERRNRDSSSGFDEDALYQDILRSQQALVSQGQKVGREAQQAAQAAGAIEAGKLFSSKGLSGGLEETLRGAMSASSASALGESQAKRQSDLLKQAEGIGTQMVEKEAARASRKAEGELRKASEAGSFMSTLGSFGGLAAGGAGALAGMIPAVGGALAGGPASLPLLIGGLIASGIGAAGSAGAGNEARKANSELRGIANQAAAFEAPGTQGISNVLSAGPGYKGFESSFLGGQGNRRPRQVVEDSSPYEGYLSSLYG
tara:strand:+ start:3545 stop:4384 length:840 start_codon:yes stop_codon:yes gene_type:complete